jgi:hypothetical protein
LIILSNVVWASAARTALKLREVDAWMTIAETTSDLALDVAA